MIVVNDGDIVPTEVRRGESRPLPISAGRT